MTYLLDTHVLLWWIGARERLSREQLTALETASEALPLCVSDISLWEIAMLVARGRIVLQVPLRAWLEAATALPLVRRTGITPEIAAEVAALPASFQRDPADRILVASARVLNATLLTSDDQIRDAGLAATL